MFSLLGTGSSLEHVQFRWTTSAGVVDLLLEYMDSRYPQRPQAPDLLYVSVQRQMLFHVHEGRSVATYPISTAMARLGSEQGNYRTPTGLHQGEQFGDDVPPLGDTRGP